MLGWGFNYISFLLCLYWIVEFVPFFSECSGNWHEESFILRCMVQHWLGKEIPPRWVCVYRYDVPGCLIFWVSMIVIHDRLRLEVLSDTMRWAYRLLAILAG